MLSLYTDAVFFALGMAAVSLIFAVSELRNKNRKVL
jgi:hypothetical protein